MAGFLIAVRTAEATTCDAGSVYDTTECIVYLTTTGSGTWTVPNDWNSSNNSISVIGGGGGASNAYNYLDGGGGGGTPTQRILL